MKRLLGAALAFAMLLAGGVANATDLFTIIDGVPDTTSLASGTFYPYPGGPGPGAGVPSQQGGWPTNGPGIGLEPSTQLLGTTGFDGGYLQLNADAKVTIQFMGGGDSSLNNSFWLFYDADGNGPAVAAWHQLFQDSHGGSNTFPCPVGPGSTDPVCDHPAPSPAPCADLFCNQYTIPLSAGLIPFLFDVNGVFDLNVAHNDGVHNSLVPPGFFLAIDPYHATGQFQTTGDAAYAALSDLPPADHDFQDMVVRFTPEPGSLLLLGGGLIALAGIRRRKA